MTIDKNKTKKEIASEPENSINRWARRARELELNPEMKKYLPTSIQNCIEEGSKEHARRVKAHTPSEELKKRVSPKNRQNQFIFVGGRKYT